jgi:hypothetical protein
MTVFSPDSVVQIARTRLKPYKNNPRTHSEAQVDRLVRSLKEFGFTNPILIDKDLNVVAGHGRLMAAEIIGLETVPTISLDHLTEDQKKAYVIADNQLAIAAGWDDDILQSEIVALADVGFDTTLLGWGDDIPTFGEEIDLSALDDEEDLSEFAAGVRRGIMVDFEEEDHEEAKALIDAARKRGEYVGMKLIEALRDD